MNAEPHCTTLYGLYKTIRKETRKKDKTPPTRMSLSPFDVGADMTWLVERQEVSWPGACVQAKLRVTLPLSRHTPDTTEDTPNTKEGLLQTIPLTKQGGAGTQTIPLTKEWHHIGDGGRCWVKQGGALVQSVNRTPLRRERDLTKLDLFQTQ